ncbi:MAG: hypothetical protein LUF04_11650, partial [Bacteroides sp.]|nr:hypothetical protein [Bacteroides sp.]
MMNIEMYRGMIPFGISLSNRIFVHLYFLFVPFLSYKKYMYEKICSLYPVFLVFAYRSASD